MPSLEILADIFTRLSVFDSHKVLSDTLKTCKNISLYFKKKVPNNIENIVLDISYCKPRISREQCTPRRYPVLKQVKHTKLCFVQL